MSQSGHRGLEAGERAQEESEATRLHEALRDAFLEQVLVRRVLTAQIQGAIETSNMLATTVINEADATHRTAGKLTEFVELASAAAGDVLGRVRRAIDTADQLEREVLEKQTQRLSQKSARSSKMLAEQRRLERIGDEAQALGMRIRIVAMNTNIQSFRTGGSSDASTIGVLAREIGALASDVQKLGLELSDSLGTLSRDVEGEMVEGIAREAEAIEEVRNTLACQVTDLRASHAQLGSFRQSIIRQVEQTGKEVSTHAFNTLGGVQNQDILRQRLEQVLNVLHTLAERDETLRAALAGDLPLPPEWRPVSADELEGQYVMEAQRTAHAMEVSEEGLQPASSGPAIELF